MYAIYLQGSHKHFYLLQFSSYPKCTLHDDYGRLLESKQFCDVDFIVGTEKTRIEAHIAMVAARSSWLMNKIKQARDKVWILYLCVITLCLVSGKMVLHHQCSHSNPCSHAFLIKCLNLLKKLRLRSLNVFYVINYMYSPLNTKSFQSLAFFFLLNSVTFFLPFYLLSTLTYTIHGK